MKILLAAALAASSLLLAGCTEDPCKDVPALDEEQRRAAVELLQLDDRFEIEYAVDSDTDCELHDDGTFGEES